MKPIKENVEVFCQKPPFGEEKKEVGTKLCLDEKRMKLKNDERAMETLDEADRRDTDLRLKEFNYSDSEKEELFDIDFATRVNDTASLKIKRLRANNRERRRVNLINSAMENLRKVVPVLRERRKITKLELLRCAYRYIWLLNQSLQTGKTVQELEQVQYYYPSVVNNFPGADFSYGYIHHSHP